MGYKIIILDHMKKKKKELNKNKNCSKKDLKS